MEKTVHVLESEACAEQQFDGKSNRNTCFVIEGSNVYRVSGCYNFAKHLGIDVKKWCALHNSLCQYTFNSNLAARNSAWNKHCKKFAPNSLYTKRLFLHIYTWGALNLEIHEQAGFFKEKLVHNKQFFLNKMMKSVGSVALFYWATIK